MTMLEKAARAMYDSHPWGDEDVRECTFDALTPEWRAVYGKGVRAVLAAIRKPSMAQLAAAQAAWLNDPEKKSSTIYTSMIDAILEGETK